MLLHENRLDHLRDEQSIGIKLCEPVVVDQKSKDLVNAKKISGKMVSLYKKYNWLGFTPLGAISAELGLSFIIVGDILIESGFKLKV